jgi:CheY-like chemotaxis protein
LDWKQKLNCAHGIISDFRMPGVDGIEFLRALRKK